MHIIVKVTHTELKDINRLMGYGDVMSSCMKNLAKDAVMHWIFMASQMMGWDGETTLECFRKKTF